MCNNLDPNMVNRIQDLMNTENIDLLMIPLGINFRYFFGILEDPSERLILGMISKDSKTPMLITPSFEEERMKSLTGVSSNEIISWEDGENPFDKLKKELNYDFNRIGIEPKMWYTFFSNIQKVYPNTDFVNAEKLINTMRSIKSEQEIRELRKAGDISGKTIINFIENDLETGMTEKDAYKILINKLKFQNNSKSFGLVQFGENSAIPHYHYGDRKLKNGDVILIDAGGSWNNYYGDITVNAYWDNNEVSQASKDVQEIFSIVYEANKCGKQAVKDNKTASEIDAAVRSYIDNKGYGKYFTHRTGHGLGLEVHEEPYIVSGNDLQIVNGHSFTIEPGIYLPGKFGIRVEDNVIKTENDDGFYSTEFDRFQLLRI